MKTYLILLSLLGSAQAGDRAIGSVDGQAVYESQIQGTSEFEREQSLRGLFVGPALKAYLEPHRTQWQLTEQEIEGLATAYRESLKCTQAKPRTDLPDFDRYFAQFIGANLKVQRFIYEHNGGGRILFQQAGPEAFDATRNLILRLEREGAFAITDVELREKTLRYWLNERQPGLLEDPGPDKAFKLDQAVAKCPRS